MAAYVARIGRAEDLRRAGAVDEGLTEEIERYLRDEPPE